jgi:hypothetical protein
LGLVLGDNIFGFFSYSLTFARRHGYPFSTDDKVNMTNARSALFAPVAEPCREISEKARVEVGY